MPIRAVKHLRGRLGPGNAKDRLAVFARCLRHLERDNARLMKLAAELSLDKDALQAVIRKNGWSLQNNGALWRP